MRFNVRIASASIGVALVATACGGSSSKPVAAQPSVSSPPVVSATPSPTPVVTTPVVTPTPIVPKPAPVVTLGIRWASNPYMKGYGTARPSEISAGGDGSGNVEDITWDSWGGAQATGTGTARYGAGSYGMCGSWLAANPGKDCTQRVPIIAYNLTNCGGHQGYSAVEWYFPQVGETRDLSKPSYGLPSYDICSSDGVSAVIPTPTPTPTTAPVAPAPKAASSLPCTPAYDGGPCMEPPGSKKACTYDRGVWTC
jgi:hypothetical protein